VKKLIALLLLLPILIVVGCGKKLTYQLDLSGPHVERPSDSQHVYVIAEQGLDSRDILRLNFKKNDKPISQKTLSKHIKSATAYYRGAEGDLIDSSLMVPDSSSYVFSGIYPDFDSDIVLTTVKVVPEKVGLSPTLDQGVYTYPLILKNHIPEVPQSTIICHDWEMGCRDRIVEVTEDGVVIRSQGTTTQDPTKSTRTSDIAHRVWVNLQRFEGDLQNIKELAVVIWRSEDGTTPEVDTFQLSKDLSHTSNRKWNSNSRDEDEICRLIDPGGALVLSAYLVIEYEQEGSFRGTFCSKPTNLLRKPREVTETSVNDDNEFPQVSYSFIEETPRYVENGPFSEPVREFTLQLWYQVTKEGQIRYDYRDFKTPRQWVSDWGFSNPYTEEQLAELSQVILRAIDTFSVRYPELDFYVMFKGQADNLKWYHRFDDTDGPWTGNHYYFRTYDKNGMPMLSPEREPIFFADTSRADNDSLPFLRGMTLRGKLDQLRRDERVSGLGLIWGKVVEATGKKHLTGSICIWGVPRGGFEDLNHYFLR